MSDTRISAKPYIIGSTSTGFVVPTGAVGGSSILSFTDNQDASFGTRPTPAFTGANIGAAFANRRVLICFSSDASYHSPQANNITIQGITSTIVNTYVGSGGNLGSFGGVIIWAWADVPTGTTADIDYSDGPVTGDGPLYISVFTFDKSLIINSSPVSSFTNVIGATSDTVTVNTGLGGFILAAIVPDFFNTDIINCSVTASTETLTQLHSQMNVGVGAKYQIYGLMSGSHVNTPTSVTFGWTNASQALASILAWN